MNIVKLVVAVLIFVSTSASAIPHKYWVFFKDKPNCESFNPQQFFHPKALERRALNQFPIHHYDDCPVNQSYLEQIESVADSIGHASRWFNAVGAYLSDEQLAVVKSMHFVERVELMTMHSKLASAKGEELKELSASDQFVLENQLAHFQIEALHSRGFTGKGIRVAVFDAGFPSVDEHPAFDHLRNRNGIVGTYDFVAKKTQVYHSNQHGCNTLSNVCGKKGNQLLGAAPDADVMLARTEKGMVEILAEEDNWLAAVEWADQNGADIINSSLGYTAQRYFRNEMDGQKALVTRAANMAARRGILVVNSAGNEGDSGWKTIGAPADADSVLTVGGIDPFTDVRINFSSFGPSSDFRMKPNVCGFGYAVVAKQNGGFGTAYGTSFSSPLVAGYAACVRQAFPALSVMELHQRIAQSGKLYPYFDYALGFGAPQANRLFASENDIEQPPTFTTVITDDSIHVTIAQDHFNPPSFYELEEGFKTLNHEQVLYYHLAREQGHLAKYAHIKVAQMNPISFSLKDLKSYAVLRIHYRNYTEEIQIKQQ